MKRLKDILVEQERKTRAGSFAMVIWQNLKKNSVWKPWKLPTEGERESKMEFKSAFGETYEVIVRKK